MIKVKIDEGVKAFLFLLLISQLIFPDGIYLIACMAIFYIGFYSLHQPYKPSIFTIIFIYHFLQIIAGVWLNIYLERDINFRSPYLGLATIINLIGLIIMFAPIIYYQNKLPSPSRAELLNHANQFSIKTSFRAYIIAFFAAGTLQSLRFVLAGFTEVIVSLVVFKWMFFLLFAFQSILKNKLRKELYFFIAFEFISGLGFFSDFKTVFFFLLVIYLTLLRRITVKELTVLTLIAGFTFSAALLWTNIKGEYRSYLNKGQGTQTVDVSKNEALSKLYELSNMNSQGVTTATSRFLDRLQATYHFAKAMEQVPARIPYQKGRNWMESFEFIFTPRILNPEKPISDASIKASKYTGIQYAGFKQGTAVSLGYFGDSYIDFGVYGMMVILFALGWFYAAIYLFFLKNVSGNYIFNYSVVAALFMQLYALETDNTYLIGRLIATAIVFYAVSKFLFPTLIKMLSNPSTTSGSQPIIN